MHLTVIGTNLPGRTFCDEAGATLDNVHVGIQRRRDAVDLIPGDAAAARWEVDVDVVERDGAIDFRGPVVQGRPGARFVYLTWGDVESDGTFSMFRRAKLMLHRIPGDLVRPSLPTAVLVATVDLTGPDGGPRCARIDPPAIDWRLELV